MPAKKVKPKKSSKKKVADPYCKHCGCFVEKLCIDPALCPTGDLTTVS